MLQANETPCPHCGQVHGAGAPARAAQEGLAIGAPAPEVRLPDLAGNHVSFADFRGRETLVVFWNPGCGFCQQLLPELKEWEQHKTDAAPEVILVSSGSVDDNKQQDFKSTIVLDDAWQAGAAFGASGTPSAVLLDAEGRIAGPLGIGGPAVMSLAKGNRA